MRRRWIKGSVEQYARRANAILTEHGAVHGNAPYEKRHEARWRAERLIGLMVDLGLHERWELRQHVEQRRGGYVWSIEYVGRRLHRVNGGENA